MAEYFAELEAGRAVDWRELVSRHPELARELSAFFSQHHELGRILDSCARLEEPRGTDSATTGAVKGAKREAKATATIDQAARTGGEGRPCEDDMEGGDGAAEPGGMFVRYFGDYELRKVLGRGGMGIVYQAQQLSLNRPVALKMIRAGLWADSEEVRRFRNEAVAVANLDHPGIVPVFEVGQHQGQHYFSMKLVEGPSLDKVLDDYKSKSKAAAQMLAAVARAVHHAHQRGILHRDLKPSNILLDRSGVPHVTDFGLARRIEGDSSLSVSGAILGTPQYMSPEQASGARRAVTTATDVYGLGAVLYTVLSGRPPFHGESVIDTLEQVRECTPDLPSKLNPKVPHDLEVITLKCLDKDPKRRYASAHEMAEDLDRFLRGQPILARRTGPWERALKWARRQPAVAGLVTASLVAALASVGLAVAIPLYMKTVAAQREAKLQADRAEQFEYVFRISLVERYWRDAKLSQAREMLLEVIPPSRRNWEWFYLDRLLNSTSDVAHISESRTLGRHDGAVCGVAFSKATGVCVSAGADGTVRSWNSNRDDSFGVIGRLGRPVSCIATSSDGSLVAAAGSSTMPERNGVEVRIWSISTGQEVFRRTTIPTTVTRIALSPDGERVAVACDGGDSGHQGVMVWDVQSKEEPRYVAQEKKVSRLAFSPDGQHLAGAIADSAVTGKTAIKLWDARDGSESLEMEILAKPGALAFSPDGRQLLAGEGSIVRAWDVRTGWPILNLSGHLKDVRDLAFNANGTRLASASDDGTIKVWDWDRHRRTTPVRHSAFRGFTTEGTKITKRPRDAVHAQALLTLNFDTNANPESVSSLAFNADGRTIVAAGSRGAVRLFDGRPRFEIP